MKVDQDIMSPFMKEVLLENRKTDRHESTKLMSTFLPKTKYICHAANLSLYLQQGLILVKVHRALKFTTSKFLEQYIKYCTEKRKQATSDFRKRLFKAFSNSNFGKVGKASVFTALQRISSLNTFFSSLRTRESTWTASSSRRAKS